MNPCREQLTRMSAANEVAGMVCEQDRGGPGSQSKFEVRSASSENQKPSRPASPFPSWTPFSYADACCSLSPCYNDDWKDE